MSQLKAEHVFPSGQRLEISQGDLTQESVDAIVNAANQHLQHGGGVAAAISHQGGPVIQIESDWWVKEHGVVDHAHPAWTSGGNLPARYVIHAVGPVWGSGSEERKLTDAITGSLSLADELELHSISFPAISTGIFGFPVGLAARIFIHTIDLYFQQHPQSELNQVRLTLYDSATLNTFLQAYHDHFSA